MKKYISTRGGQQGVDFCQAVLQGIASDGGLLVPGFSLPRPELEGLQGSSYVSLASEIISSFAPPEDKAAIAECCSGAYGSGLFPAEVVPLRKVGPFFMAELFHGKTAAFKDLALSVLPRLMTHAIRKAGIRKALILTATSGDTGKAALEGFKDAPGTEIMVFYPTDGVSAAQKRQMITQEGGNVNVIGIKGNFDDTQRAVKEAFADEEVRALSKRSGTLVSSANSINIGRLVPQIVYYFYTYLDLVRRGEISLGEKVRFCVPSGNFGDCLAGWAAMNMGLPAEKLLVASNRNNVLTGFFNSGEYDISSRPFYKTIAPAMDILVSSNLERLLWQMEGEDRVKGLMRQLKENGRYEVGEESKSLIKKYFSAGYSDDGKILGTIRHCFEEYGYVLDTHTACAYALAEEYGKEHGNAVKTVVLSTASPFKFADSVCFALTGERLESLEAIDRLSSLAGASVPQALQGLRERPVRHAEVIGKSGIIPAVKALLSA